MPPPSALALRTACHALLDGEVIACPTEAVWGLSCDPENEEAVEYLLALKARPASKGLILVAHDMEQLNFLLAGFSGDLLATLSASWPGPATWLVPHRDRVPDWISGDHDTVAVRVSGHPVLSALCAAWGGPLVSTSANPAGAQPARQAWQVRRYFGDSLGCILPGATGSARQPTTIRDLISGRVIRD